MSFWDDTWVKDKPVSSLLSRQGAPDFARVEEFWTDTGWNEATLSNLMDEWGISREVVEEILLIPIDHSARDICRWNLTSNGNFTVASAWELLRHRGEPLGVYNIIWSKGISPTLSVFLWRQQNPSRCETSMARCFPCVKV